MALPRKSLVAHIAASARLLQENPQNATYHSGLKKIKEPEFKALAQAFHASRPIELPSHTRARGHGHNRGGEGAIHCNLKNYVASNPAVAHKEAGLRLVKLEYEVATNDRADIVLVDQHNRIVGVEIEPSVTDINLVGLLQAIKYRNMLECVADREPGESRGMLSTRPVSPSLRVAMSSPKISNSSLPYPSTISSAIRWACTSLTSTSTHTSYWIRRCTFEIRVSPMRRSASGRNSNSWSLATMPPGELTNSSRDAQVQ